MAETTHLVITVHGIRTYGDWQDELKKLLEAAEPGVTVRMYRYGFFSSLAFLIPPLRWLVGRRFQRFFEQEIRSAPEGARIDVVAHSFGTYLAASALRHLPERRKIHTVIFAGSVLRPSFPWYKYLQSGAVGRVVNDCGWEDSVLVLCQSTALLMGMAGRIGFHGMIGDRFSNRYYRWGHGGYFDREQRFMREAWLPLLTRDGPVPAHDERPQLTTWGGIRLFFLNNMQLIKVAFASLLLMLIVFIPLDWYRKAEFQKRVERLNHLALLTNAQEIPGRDPTHVRDLLRIDARASGDENAIDNLIGTENPSDSRDVEAIDAQAEPRWYEWLPGLANSSREGFRARLYHHLANELLVASNKETGAGNNAKALAYFQTALSSYRRINNNDPAHGSYALCLIDYAQLLAGMAEHTEAIRQFQLVRNGVFPPATSGKPSSQPISLEVDSLISEASSWKALQKWKEARDCLNKAIAIAENKPDHALTSDARNESAWLSMDRLDVNAAVKDFEAAEDACRKVMRDQVAYKIRLFHIRHGLALADRLKGKAGESYDQYQQIVADLRTVMEKDLTFTPKQRRDLRDRLFNTLERRADVRFFARQEPSASAVGGESARLVGFATQPPATSTDDFATVEDDYQEAIELIGNDELSKKVRILYKKVIARFVGNLEKNDPMAVPERRGRHKVLDPIDLEFAEANRTMKTLSTGQRDDLELYHAIAKACMALRASVTPRANPTAAETGVEVTMTSQRAARIPAVFFAPQAVEKLRALTVKNAADCAKLTREKVEMLLLAHEILLRLGIEADSTKRASDATRMMAVLGVTTDVASHAELSPYFERFQRIAADQTASAVNVAEGGRSPVHYHETVARRRTSPEIVRFSLQLGPWFHLKVTSQPMAPPTVPSSIDDGMPPEESLSRMP